MGTETRSAQTKALILDLLSSNPQKSYTWAEMREHVNKSLSITNGIFAGSIQALTSAGKIERKDRGVYAITAEYDSGDLLSPRIVRILRDAENSIRQEAQGIKILNLEEADFLTIRHIQKLLADLERLRTGFEKNISSSINI